MKNTRWWLIRHAPVPNPGNVIYGRSDPAADTGDSDALAALAARLPPQAVWVTSHLHRTRQTAAALRLPSSDMALVERALAEQDFGRWEGLSHDAVAELHPEEARRFWSDPAAEAPPDGESFAAVMERVAGAVGRLTDLYAGCDIVAVIHGGSIRAALALALDLTPQAALRLAVAPLSLSRIDHYANEGDGFWSVAAMNALGTFPGSGR
ncbi:histidine phosphatase family protein [Azospirillum brasilense]|uniref:histidine phosphatase family protein n=1 Tax=Azospirillum brasilense TaxID=192 RepID=UPI000E676AA3|nr:histidine phosphatase family protein [Azospirillum brasilense]NUB27793.1 histidine phosphatase family protein [Azospirillum brasilense]NUB33145.1 histidine phosphatase family protein [Azospirillum brasilense]RIW00905.1 histidine phosphatase family protein [Azospirillum brasilense]